MKKEKILENFSAIVYKMIQEVDTRWSSLYALLKRLDLLLLPHNQTVGELNRQDLIISTEQHRKIKDIIEVLKPLERDTKFFSTEKSPTISHVWPRLYVTCQEIKDLIIADKEVSKMRDVIYMDLTVRCVETFSSDVCIISTSLDPLWRDLKFCKDDERERFYSLVKKDALERALKDWMPPEQVVQKSPVNPGCKANPLEAFMTQNTKKAPTTQQEAKEALCKAIDVEWSLFLQFDIQDQIIDNYLNPLNWWFENKNRFPHLSRTAFVYLSVPASSVGPERKFSAIGRLTQGRYSLRPETISALVTLKDWMDDFPNAPWNARDIVPNSDVTVINEY